MTDRIAEIFATLQENPDLDMIDISQDKVLTYNHNAPLYEKILTKEYEMLNDHYISIPRVGDLLLSLKISGKFRKASFFQYSFLDRHIVYEQVEQQDDKDVIINPFPFSGIPLLQASKNFYVCLEHSENVEITASYALLNSKSRRKFVFDYNEQNGVKIMHINGTMYQVYNINDYGHSPNTLDVV